MKNFLKKTVSLLLMAALCASFAGCNLPSLEKEKPVMRVPATMPAYDVETTPVYVRPEEEIETINPIDEEPPEVEPDEADLEAAAAESETDDAAEAFAGGDVNSNMKGSIKPLSWSNINSFKTKSSGMSVSAMRNLCVDFFRYAKTASWTPSTGISYVRNAKGSTDSMTGGQLYGGLPYVGSASGNIYRLMDYMGSNGKVDMEDMLGNTSGQLSNADLRYFGNQCANGAHVGWQRVINSVSKTHTAGMTKSNGYIPLGTYKYDTSKVTSWSGSYGTDEVCRENGEQTMFASYAKLQLGDGLVYYTTAGHVIMCATDAHVEYAPGTEFIDGTKSYITIIDQAQKWEDIGGCQVKSSVDAKVTFSMLYSSHYLPFTFKEFLGTNSVEATKCSFSITGSSASMKELTAGTVTSNYAVTDAYIIIKDGSGKQVYKLAVRNASTAWGKNLYMTKGGANTDSWGKIPTSGNYTVQVVAQLGTGERPTVYSGKLRFDN